VGIADAGKSNVTPPGLPPLKGDLSDPLKSGGDKKYAPGTVWDSEKDAVRAAARYVDSLNAAHPVLKHYELGGWVYYSEDGFSFNITTSYKSNTINRSDLLSLRVGDSVAVWHTHNFLVDTGASAIALNAATAKRLDLEYIKNAPVGVKTASGITLAYPVTLDEVQVGDIKLYNVQAVVIDGPEPSRALLGMTFLGQLDMHQTGQRMDLKQKY